jgi:hypothetical protein
MRFHVPTWTVMNRLPSLPALYAVAQGSKTIHDRAREHAKTQCGRDEYAFKELKHDSTNKQQFCS